MNEKNGYLEITYCGASGYKPDDTIHAFERAIETRVDMIKLDVHTCQEKILHIFGSVLTKKVDIDLFPWLNPLRQT